MHTSRPVLVLWVTAVAVVLAGAAASLLTYRKRFDEQFAKYSALSLSHSKSLADGDLRTPGTVYVKIPGRPELYASNSRAGWHAQKAIAFKRSVGQIDTALAALLVLFALFAVSIFAFHVLKKPAAVPPPSPGEGTPDEPLPG